MKAVHVLEGLAVVGVLASVAVGTVMIVRSHHRFGGPAAPGAKPAPSTTTAPASPAPGTSNSCTACAASQATAPGSAVVPIAFGWVNASTPGPVTFGQPVRVIDYIARDPHRIYIDDPSPLPIPALM